MRGVCDCSLVWCFCQHNFHRPNLDEQPTTLQNPCFSHVSLVYLAYLLHVFRIFLACISCFFSHASSMSFACILQISHMFLDRTCLAYVSCRYCGNETLEQKRSGRLGRIHCNVRSIHLVSSKQEDSQEMRTMATRIRCGNRREVCGFVTFS